MSIEPTEIAASLNFWSGRTFDTFVNFENMLIGTDKYDRRKKRLTLQQS